MRAKIFIALCVELSSVVGEFAFIMIFCGRMKFVTQDQIIWYYMVERNYYTIKTIKCHYL